MFMALEENMHSRAENFFIIIGLLRTFICFCCCRFFLGFNSIFVSFFTRLVICLAH